MAPFSFSFVFSRLFIWQEKFLKPTCLRSGTKINVADWVKPVKIVDLTTIDYRVQSLDDIVKFEKSEHDTPKKRPREEIPEASKNTPSSDEAEEAGSEEDEEEDRQTRLFEKKLHSELTPKEEIDLCDDEEEMVGRCKAPRFADTDDDDEVEAPTTSSFSSSTTPYSENSTLKSTLGRTPHPAAIVTTKKSKGKKNKGRF